MSLRLPKLAAAGDNMKKLREIAIENTDCPIATVIAWVAAKNTAQHAFEAIQQMLKEIAAPGKILPPVNFVLAICGCLEGWSEALY